MDNIISFFWRTFPYPHLWAGCVTLESPRAANPAIAKTKVYLFTAEVEMKDSYRQGGFDGILLKPANLDSLRKLLS